MRTYWAAEFSKFSLRTFYPFTDIAWEAWSAPRVHALYDIHLICIIHPSPSFSESQHPYHLILAFFVLHKPLRPGPHLPSIPASCVRSYDFAPLRIFLAVPAESTVDGEKKEKTEIRREHRRKGVRKKGDRERDKESMKSRGRRGLLQSALKS